MSVNIIGIFDPNSPLIMGSSISTTSTITILAAAATNGQANDAPLLTLRDYYDADAGAGVTSTAWDLSLLHDMTAGGATPASSGIFKINNVAVLTLTNTNGTPKVNLGASSLYADYLSFVFNGGTDRAIAINNGGHVYFRNDTAGNGFQFKNSSDIGLFNVDQFGNFSHKAAAEGGTASLNIKIARQVVALTGASTSTTINIPAGAMLLGASFNVDTAVVTSSATNTWDADYTGGSTTNLVAASTSGNQNTKANKLIVPEIASAQTNIEFDAPGAETFSSGAIEVVAYYLDQTSLANA